MKNIYLKIAGIINLLTALLHLIGGQIDLVIPLLASSLSDQQSAEWLGLWHMVTILLFLTSYVVIRSAFSKVGTWRIDVLWTIGILYILMGIPSIASSIYLGVFAPQFILLQPIGIFILLALRRST